MNINPKTWFGGLLYSPLKHVYLLMTSRLYRQNCHYHSKYKNYQRFQESVVLMGNKKLTVPDVASFVSQFEEIYYHQIYDLPCKPSRILDLGANIGMSVLWLKDKFPESEVIAIEADPKIYRYLQMNTKDSDNVSLRNIAVWDENGELFFQAEGGDGGRLGESSRKGILVPSVDVRELLKEGEPFDFIKMDIEGAESRVIPACKGYLSETKFVFCEYHSSKGDEQYLAEIVSTLKGEGFRLHIQPINISKQPFLSRNTHAGFDMQLNIFAWK